MNKFRDKLFDFMRARYGIDELGKVLFFSSIILYFVGIIFKKSIFISIGLLVAIIYFMRVMSKNHFDRRKENEKFLRYIKLWKLRYNERKVSRIFVCKSCGKYIRVPRKKGKIEVRCRVCGYKSIHRT